MKILFVLDTGVAASHPQLEDNIRTYCDTHDKVLQFTALVRIPGGESAKNESSHVDTLLEEINKQGICRHSVVVVIGGGAVIDLTGYAASIAHRGVQIIRIPTTVLAQNDAAVGVKNGINFFGKKNFIGSFAVPLAIINDINFLSTLEDRDWIAGTAEAVKVALIKDKGFFRYLEEQAQALRNRDMLAMEELIYRCAKIHMEHISSGGDPFERGSARPLDFGHWAAHKLEYLTGYQLRHGEAVAIGMALDVCYSHLQGLISREEQERILQLLNDLGFREVMKTYRNIRAGDLLEGIQEFREHLGGELCITLPSGIGQKLEVNTIDRELMARAYSEVFLETADKKSGS